MEVERIEVVGGDLGVGQHRGVGDDVARLPLEHTALGTGRRELDAEGLALMPGIIDGHTHYDAQLTWDPFADPSPQVGVTTAVIGNCGFAIAPCRPTDRDLTMPEIGPDPDDDADIVLPQGLAAELRRHRAGSDGARLNPTLLQAFADRLEALSGRLGHSPDGRRPF